MSCPTCNPDGSCACTVAPELDAKREALECVEDLNQVFDKEISRLLWEMLESKPKFDAFVDALGNNVVPVLLKSYFPVTVRRS